VRKEGRKKRRKEGRKERGREGERKEWREERRKEGDSIKFGLPGNIDICSLNGKKS
jgi:hypothetical protein